MRQGKATSLTPYTTSIFFTFAVFFFLVTFLSLTVGVRGGHGQSNKRGSPEKITAAVLKDFPPLYTENADGEPDGFAIDVLSHVAETENIQVAYLTVENWTEAMEAVRVGEADLIPGIGISPVRSAEFLFSEVMESIPVSCFVRDGNYSIKGIESLGGFKVAVIGQSAAATKLRPRKDIFLVPFPNIDTALIQLLAGEVDAFVFPEPVLWKKARQAGVSDKIKVVGTPLMELKRGYLMRKSSTGLAEKINHAIELLTKSDHYLDLYVKWYGKAEPFWNMQRLLMAMGVLIAIVVAAMTTWRFYSLLELNRELSENIETRKKAEMELRTAQEQLLHSEKLGAIGRLAASIAHEFNNPLYGVMGVLQGVRKRAAFSADDSKLVDMSINECNRMKALIQNLQDFNRPTSGKHTRVDINESIENVLLLEQKDFKTRKINVEKNYAPDLPLVKAVADQMKQVLLNLLNNAADACVDGGTITVRTKTEGREVRIDIQDTGLGIKPENRDRIFEPFFTTKAAVKGTGLGLSISYGIVKNHGGRIDVNSADGRGTTFTVILPVNGVHNGK